MDKWLTVRNHWYSRQINTSTCTVIVLLLLITLAVALLSLASGKYMLSLPEVIDALRSRTIADNAFIVSILRTPRMLMALLAGGALAVSGLLLQTIIRNPLASPDIIGVTSGASATAVFFLSFMTSWLSVQWLPLAAMAGGFAGATLVYLLAWKSGISSTRLILVGVGISAVMVACTTMLLVFSPLSSTLSAYVWLTGSVYGARWHEVTTLCLWLLPAAILLIALARTLAVNELDDALIIGLGVSMERARLVLLALSVYLAGAAIAYTGALGFVGLVAPHIARRIGVKSGTSLIVVTMLVGANMVMIADLIGRTQFLPLDLPAGIFVSAIGAPFFIYLLLRSRS
ncbi:iron chelate uptake ABC transporter family permease subunit [Advenella sp. FME57]|uniref:FecCD family ABC transporter permease n=1 Tax=Advenella sp. FME57 TaxID=2742604 RepID=UPI001867469D|nr:iron ABC transporter permease [Advenella sp. FME57]